jgi:hypothetical protein
MRSSSIAGANAASAVSSLRPDPSPWQRRTTHCASACFAAVSWR